MFKKMDYIPTLGDAHEIMFIEIHIYYIYYIYISIYLYIYIYIYLYNIYIYIYIYYIYISIYRKFQVFWGFPCHDMHDPKPWGPGEPCAGSLAPEFDGEFPQGSEPLK